MARFQTASIFVLCVILSACGGEADTPEKAQRISLDTVSQGPSEPLPSPNLKDASWSVSENGQAINFGGTGAPMLSLVCNLKATPARLTVIRHVGTRPGQKALFPVIGNGTISRFKVDATLHQGEWRWEAPLEASDPLLDVFTGTHELEATMPGGGTLKMEGSRIPSEFVNWCRAGGRLQRVEAVEKAVDALKTPPAGAKPSPPAR
ncbi:hypothetical protein [Altererythrobacter sp. Root672]|uniref:hypothetical protein n=1 Tax=Altererythrobacter sp. Root672 TaxID=1736584 RepID=UPI0006F2B131|nr:hypothetical protein [Altererythrobacter sp. Root672]KRA82762.1 hypothetical protein ASD76_01335 [Altererythrobacter sp. Root672]